MSYIKGWHKEFLLVGRAWQAGATADAYGVTKDAFIEGVSVVHKGNYNELGQMHDIIRYRSRKWNNQMTGYNFPAAFHELQKLADCDIDTAFKWTLLAYKYDVSLEDIADVIDHDYRAVGDLLYEGYDFSTTLGILDNDIDSTLISALVQ